MLADCLRGVATLREDWPESMEKQLKKALLNDLHAAKHYRLLVELLEFSGLDLIWDHKMPMGTYHAKHQIADGLRVPSSRHTCTGKVRLHIMAAKSI